jgi:hypothetical protein
MTPVAWRAGEVAEVNDLLRQNHYLGPIKSGAFACIVIGHVGERIVAAQVWRRPTSRRLPSDGSWLELSRWCLTPAAGLNAGTRQHAAGVKILKARFPELTTLVSYSDPSQGHTGALYRACNWRWSPTWHRLRPPPTGSGNWGTEKVQHVKDRWIFEVRRDRRRESLLLINDRGAIRRWLSERHTDQEMSIARRSLAADLREALS